MTPPDVENVVLVTVDSLRSDAVGYGAAESNTPTIDEIAAHGTVFENAFANANWTPFSFPGIFASAPVFSGDGDIGVGAYDTLAEALNERGYETGGFNAANGFLTEHWGYDDGFDSFEAFVATSRFNPYSHYLAAHPTVQGWVQLLSSPFRRFVRQVRGDDIGPVADTSKLRDVERGATAFIEAATEPFFLWIHYMDTHTPYVPAPRYLRAVSSDPIGTPRMFSAHVRTGLGWTVGPQLLKDLRTLYDACVRQVDASVGRIRETLVEHGHGDDTCLIVAGDHGEEFQEHGHLAHYPKLYDELIHVPFVVDVPGASSRSVETHVGLDAIPPTVADLVGVDAPTSWLGHSLAETVVAGADPPSDPVISVAVRGESVTEQPIPRQLADGDLLVSARTREWAYILNTKDDSEELYHRPSDPDQQTNVLGEESGERPPILAELQRRAREHADALAGAERERDSVVDDEQLSRRLEALGYQ